MSDERKEQIEIQREAYKQAFKELMAEVGIWTVKGFFTALAAILLYMTLIVGGWHK